MISYSLYRNFNSTMDDSVIDLNDSRIRPNSWKYSIAHLLLQCLHSYYIAILIIERYQKRTNGWKRFSNSFLQLSHFYFLQREILYLPSFRSFLYPIFISGFHNQGIVYQDSFGRVKALGLHSYYLQAK